MAPVVRWRWSPACTARGRWRSAARRSRSGRRRRWPSRLSRVLARPVDARAERPEHAAHVPAGVNADVVSRRGRGAPAQGGEVQLRGAVRVRHGVHAAALHDAVHRHAAHVAQAGGVHREHELLDDLGERRAAGRGRGVGARGRRGLKAEAAVAYVGPVQRDGGRVTRAHAAFAAGERCRCRGGQEE